MNFLFAEGGDYLLPENRFDTIIFPQAAPPPEVFLAVKAHGKIYFAAQDLEEALTEQATVFPLTKNVALFEVGISTQLRQELYSRTPQVQLDEKKSEKLDFEKP